MGARELTPEELDWLGDVAASAVVAAVRGVEPTTPEPPGGPLGEPGAAFVTVLHEGALRGCIGSLVAARTLVQEVVVRAVAASRHDPRFPPLRVDELAAVEVEVSVLSTPETLAVTGHAELVGLVRPGVDGLIVAAQHRRATLLPSVWQQLPDPVEFLDVLWRKAGLPRGYWSADLLVQRYVAQHSAARSVLTATGAGAAAGSVRGRLAPATEAHRTRTSGPRGRR